MPTAEPCPLTIRVARSISEVEEMRETWTAWQSHPTSDIDNFLLILRFRPEIERPHVMIVERDGQPDTILVGRLETTQLSFKVGYCGLFRAQARVLCFMHGGLFGNDSAENSEFLVREIGKCLSRGEADIARFEHQRTDSFLAKAANDIPGIFSRDHFAPTELHGAVRLPETYEDFLRSLSRKERHNFNRCANKINNDFPGEMRIQCFREENQMAELVRITEEVARKTYQRGLGVGFRDNAEIRDWLRMAAQKGTLRACVLFIKDQPCAFMIGKQYQHTLHGDFMGYDPHYHEYSPGSQLLLHWIQDAFVRTGQDKISEIDLGCGDARYKRAIFTHTWQESVFYVFAPTFKGLTLNFQSTLTRFVSHLAKNMMKSCGSLETVKRFWRSAVRVPQRQPSA
jgi:hypothetical protein